MGRKNKGSIANNSFSTKEMRSTKGITTNQDNDHEFSEELSDGGERNEIITRQQDQ